MSNANMNTNLKVKNVSGSGDRRPAGFSSWLDFWRDDTGSERNTCGALGCSDDAELGSHVVIVDGRSDDTHYIAPLCHACNQRTDDFFLASDVKVVPVAGASVSR